MKKKVEKENERKKKNVKNCRRMAKEYAKKQGSKKWLQEPRGKREEKLWKKKAFGSHRKKKNRSLGEGARKILKSETKMNKKLGWLGKIIPK